MRVSKSKYRFSKVNHDSGGQDGNVFSVVKYSFEKEKKNIIEEQRLCCETILNVESVCDMSLFISMKKETGGGGGEVLVVVVVVVVVVEFFLEQLK